MTPDFIGGFLVGVVLVSVAMVLFAGVVEAHPRVGPDRRKR